MTWRGVKVEGSSALSENLRPGGKGFMKFSENKTIVFDAAIGKSLSHTHTGEDENRR